METTDNLSQKSENEITSQVDNVIRTEFDLDDEIVDEFQTDEELRYRSQADEEIRNDFQTDEEGKNGSHSDEDARNESHTHEELNNKSSVGEKVTEATQNLEMPYRSAHNINDLKVLDLAKEVKVQTAKLILARNESDRRDCRNPRKRPGRPPSAGPSRVTKKPRKTFYHGKLTNLVLPRYYKRVQIRPKTKH